MVKLQRRTWVRHGIAGGAALVLLAALALLAAGGAAVAAPAAGYALTIHDDKFEPETLAVPAGERVKIAITNARKAPSEFESAELSREKIVPAGLTLDLWIGPLKPGKYGFFDDFNPSVKGWIEATPKGQ